MSDPFEPYENRDDADGGYARDAGGKFKPGTKGGPGSPQARHARQIRARLNDALFKVCSPERLVSVVDAILKLAEAGDVQAAKLLFERIAGPPISSEIAERLEELERMLGERTP